MTDFERYIAASYHASFKRDGRHGFGWCVSDRALGVRVATVETREEAFALAAHLNAGGVVPTSRTELLRLTGG